MKTLIILGVGLLSVGCGKTKLQQEALRDSIIGEYEFKDEDGNTCKYFFLENGIRKWYRNGQKANEDNKWSIVDGELHILIGDKGIEVSRINTDRSITNIATITPDGKRLDYSIISQHTYKKIK